MEKKTYTYIYPHIQAPEKRSPYGFRKSEGEPTMGLSVYKQGVCTRESIFQQHVAGSVYVGDLTDPGNITGDSAEQLPVF